MIDTYLYPGTEVLVNKFQIKDAEKLQDLESAFFKLKISEPLPLGNFDYPHLKAIHLHFFGEIYEWAGEERIVDIIKGQSHFARKEFITPELNKIFIQLKSDNYLQSLNKTDFCKKLAFYFNEINAAHPFREGNGRTLRAFCELLSENAGYYLDWTKIKSEEYIQANIKGFNENYEAMETLFQKISFSINKDQFFDFNYADLNSKSMENLKIYVEKQVYLSELIKQKNDFLLKNQKKFENCDQEISKINKELKNIAKLLINSSDIQTLLKQPQITSLKKQGGFSAIHERFQNNRVNFIDVITTIRHANNYENTLDIYQKIGQEKGRSY